MWFKQLTGFDEKTPQQVRENLSVQDGVLTSRINGKRFICGKLETPSLAELRQRVNESNFTTGKNTVRELVGNVQRLHCNAQNAGALFQVASQFNLLEMVSPNVSPEDGITRYAHDLTQGPACAIAAGAGTIYRNYFVPLGDSLGQSSNQQIDCLAELGAALGNHDNRLWEMRNGYALPSENGLREIKQRLHNLTEAERDELKQRIRVGVHWNTQVTLNDCGHLVSQIYCSALPVAYGAHASHLWQEFAQLVLDAAYEATLCSAILNAQTTGNRTLYLTLLGGGAFGNELDWILTAIQRALNAYADTDLEIIIVSYGRSNSNLKGILE